MLPSILLFAALQIGTIHGTVRAGETLEPVPYATVEIVELDRTVATNDRGYFVVPGVPAGSWTVRASALGYATREITVRVPGDGSVRVDLELEVRPVELADINVEAEAGGAPVTAAGPPPVRVEGASLSLVPGLAEADVFRALQMLPSVAAASDYSSALYVRGGLPNQNLILLDGMPLFNPYHLGGLFAAIDPGAVRSVGIRSGAFPAHAGDRLSSIVRIRTRNGGRDRIRGNGAIGLFSSRVGLDGPLPGGEGSFLLSIRRTYLDLFTDVAKSLGLISFTVPYAFTDGYLKLTRDVGATGSLSASVYLDAEALSIPEEERRESGDNAQFGWGSRAASIGYRQPLSATVLGRFRIAWSSFYGSFLGVDGTCAGCIPEPTETWLKVDSHTRNLRATADFTWYRRNHELRTGIELNRFDIQHAIPVANTDDFIPEFRRASEVASVAAYAEDTWEVNESLRLRAGLRVLGAENRGIEWMPRLGARLSLTPRFAVSVGAGRYAQLLHSLKNPESAFSGLIAYDLLDAVPADIGYTTARDVVVGVRWANATTNIRLDAYMKWMDGLPLSPIPADPANTSPLAVDGHVVGTGTARGVELFVRHLWNDAEFTLSYALASATRRIGAEEYRPRFHRLHSGSATAIVPVGDAATVSARLKLSSGQPYTPVVGAMEQMRYDPATGKFTGPQMIAVVRGEHNSKTLPAYFRLDVAARKSWDVQWFGTDLRITPYLQIINVLNTPNVLFGVPEAGFTQPVFEYTPQLPILPTFGVEWRF